MPVSEDDFKKRLEENIEKGKERFSNLQKETSSVHKEIKDFQKAIKKADIVTWFVPFFFSVAIVFGFVGIFLYPSEAPEIKAVIALTGSALLLGGAGLVLSFQSIRYSNLYTRWSIIISDFQKIEYKTNRARREIEDWKKI